MAEIKTVSPLIDVLCMIDYDVMKDSCVTFKIKKYCCVHCLLSGVCYNECDDCNSKRMHPSSTLPFHIIYEGEYPNVGAVELASPLDCTCNMWY